MTTTPSAGQEAPTAPTCYRHPGRQTWVSCVRCGRPACPDCLRPAAVGFQCVDCVRQGTRATRGATGAFGGRIVSAARVTWAIMALNAVLYLIQLAYPNLANDWLMIGAGVASGQWYRMITSAFLPGPGYLGLLDIAFNMWVLYIVGPPMERLLGHVRFTAVYLASALGGALSFYFLVNPYEGALGASGAIFGLFGGLLVLARRLRFDWRPVGIVIVFNLVLGFVGSAYIAWQDHIGGLITGTLLTAVYAYAPRRGRTLTQVAATVAVLGLIIAGVALRDYQLVGRIVL